MKNEKIIRGFAVIITVLIVLLGCFAFAYFITSFIYIAAGNEMIDELPPVFTIISLLISILFVFLVKWYLVHRNITQSMGILGPIIQVMEKISKGDFQVRLDNTIQENEPLVKLVRSVNNMASDLDRMEKMRQEFISNVSHEIQSPLASIRGFAHALQNDELGTEERKHYLNIIETESMRLSKLSDNLLKLASLESESTKYEPKVYRLDKQLRNLILACEPQWMDREINMEVSLEEVSITADEDLMSQVWINLIRNSIKFTPEDGRVCVDLHQQGDRIEIKISDTGIGIAEEDQTYIFERFYKADKSRESSNKGSGLGLSIVKKIVDMHHGTIGVQSKLSAGTTFIVTLPNSHKIGK